MWLIPNYIICLIILLKSCNCDEISITSQVHGNELAKKEDHRLLIFSTLDGYLYGINRETGSIKWKIKDKSVVQVPRKAPDEFLPMFLPDPQGGSLYLVGNGKESFKKLPFTIPELVSTSPCRSSDGILYTGKKKDTWYTIDPDTGNKQHVLGWDFNGPTCPVANPNAIYIGRTEYNIMMVDSKNPKRKWNITFYEYSSVAFDKDTLANYDMLHFTSSSTGNLISLDRIRGSVLWQQDLGSPIVASYILDQDGLIALPFTSLSNFTISSILNNENSINSQMKLYPTLYIGEHKDGLYALQSFVDQNMITLTSNDGKPLLLEGPIRVKDKPWVLLPGENYPLQQHQNTVTYRSLQGKFTSIYYGHYNVPEYTEMRLQIAGSSHIITKLITDESLKSITFDDSHKANVTNKWMNNSKYVFGFIFCLAIMYIYFKKLISVKFGNFGEHQTSISPQRGFVINQVSELPEGSIKIGKIIFNPDQLLGKGCEGTFVYRGEFDGRRVAVKRILPECFNIADREVSLLRESDAHPNVIRYFCMEQDNTFRYIALELCQATLCDYVQGDFSKHLIEPLEILKQATLGLEHLHSLSIVHRDIKPQNVLLSIAGPTGVRAMISDFGLCKKLQTGKDSFSRGSGIAGTDGWIAPEMLTENKSTTHAVDMFSLGCLYYYVLSDGEHPFGDKIRRQGNILSGYWTMDEIKEDQWKVEVCKPLLVSLISSEPADRPSCKAVLNYPIFWNNKTILNFLQDVSDRVESTSHNDRISENLEAKAPFVIRGDWRDHLDEALICDLAKYRGYKGHCLKDLLRAIRNKRHHYRELSEESREVLGMIPNQFLSYWTQHFPLMFAHVWIVMQCLSVEELFQQYYSVNIRYKNTVNYRLHSADLYERETRNRSMGIYRNETKVQNRGGEGKKKKKRSEDVPLKWVLTT